MIKSNVKRIYEISPNDSHKSFYGKARVAELENGERVLISYNTPVIYENNDGELFRLWWGWSATTGRHIRAFCGLNKKEYENLPFMEA